MYSKQINNDFCYIIVYVDDLLVACPNLNQIQDIENTLTFHFKINNLGQIKNYLGMEVTKDESGNFELCQSKYILNTATDFGLMDAKEAKTPLEVNYGKSNESTELENNTKYRRLIGRLLYLSVNSRPDISASVSILAQKVSKPTSEDWNQVKRVVRYLKSTCKMKLKLSNIQYKNFSMFCYADATWADDRQDRKSNSGRIIFLNDGTVSWSCQKQKMVSASTCEAEFISVSEAAKEIKWLRQLLEEMHEKIESPTTIYEDNQGCIELVRDSKFSYRTKHIDTRYKMIRDYARKKIIELVYCPTDEMFADLLTKPLHLTKHEYFREKCNVV